MKLTPTQVYNKLIHLQILAGSTMRQANIFAVKHTWYYYNNQSEFVQNQSRPKYIHPTYEEAVTEAHRLAKQSQNINCKVYILAVLRSVIGTVSVNEVDL